MMHKNSPNKQSATANRDTQPRLWVAVVVAILAVSVAVVTVVALSNSTTAAAETPAERCAREIAAYNAAWKQAWAAAHPGKTVNDAPTPNPPYVCHDPQSTTPTTTTTTPPIATPGTTTSTPAPGPNITGHAPTDIPTAGPTPIVPVPSETPSPRPRPVNYIPLTSILVRIPTTLPGQDIVLRYHDRIPDVGMRAGRLGGTIDIEITRYSPSARTRFEFTTTIPAGTRWQRIGSAMQLVTATGQRAALLTKTGAFDLSSAGTNLVATFRTAGGELPSVADIIAPARHDAGCPVSCNGPTVDNRTLETELVDQALARCRVAPLGLTPDEIRGLRAQTLSGDDGMRHQNDLGSSREQLVSQGCTRIRGSVRDYMIQNFPKRFRDTTTRCDPAESGPRCEGVVAVCPPQGDLSSASQNQVRDYVNGVNRVIPPGGYLVRTGDPRPANDGQLRRAERRANPDKYPPGYEAGHVPDLTWQGATAYTFMAMTSSVNQSIGGQAGKYPVGYRARLFVVGEWVNGPNQVCMPAPIPRPGR
ncbi:hypothetical protein [Gordonia sp. NPDC003585]|uniref:hypothetical protein n=1 Tax=Gordonia sp. NPDC003585 TaxID=3154275 RepID=UPI0033A49072